jgi:2-phospho-L-lactate guanylyltransferase
MRVALIPMKALAHAKMRLAGVLDPEERAELALAMLTDVIGACAESGVFDEIAVVTTDHDVCWHVRDLGAKPLVEPATLSGLNDALTFGQRYAGRRLGADALVILPADVPLICAKDVRLVALAIDDGGRRVAVVRARDGGTNALALRPPEAIVMRFGQESADAHIRAAADAGIAALELPIERIRLDVDSPEDLEALTRLEPRAATAAWITARAHIAGKRAG